MRRLDKEGFKVAAVLRSVKASPKRRSPAKRREMIECVFGVLALESEPIDPRL